LQMVILTPEPSKKGRNVGREITKPLMDKNTQESGKMIKNTAEEHSGTQMEINTLAILAMERNQDMEFTTSTIRIGMRVNGKEE